MSNMLRKIKRTFAKDAKRFNNSRNGSAGGQFSGFIGKKVGRRKRVLS